MKRAFHPKEWFIFSLVGWGCSQEGLIIYFINPITFIRLLGSESVSFVIIGENLYIINNKCLPDNNVLNSVAIFYFFSSTLKKLHVVKSEFY